jgi:hypothetical protein
LFYNKRNYNLKGAVLMELERKIKEYLASLNDGKKIRLHHHG